MPLTDSPLFGGLLGAQARGAVAKRCWILSGEVVRAKALANRWGMTPQALGQAARRGEVFTVGIGNKRYYPNEFLQLSKADVISICRELRGLDSMEEFVFWKRAHGSLGGKTVVQVLTANEKVGVPYERVMALAKALTAQMRADAASYP